MSEKFDWEEHYLWGHYNCGLKVGDTVILLFRAKDRQWGWNCGRSLKITELIGKELTITEDGGSRGFLCNNHFYFPYFCLRKVEPEFKLPENIEKHIENHSTCSMTTLGADFLKKLTWLILEEAKRK